jgi:SAM-dependent methyltransferase
VPASRLAAVELLPQRVAATRRAVPGAAVEHADGRHLPFADGAFGLVTLLTVLSSAPDLDDALALAAEAARVAGPAGFVVIWEPRWGNPLNAQTLRIPWKRLDAILGPPRLRRELTLLPPLARRLGRLTGVAYPALARLRPLRTHRLQVYGPPA